MFGDMDGFGNGVIAERNERAIEWRHNQLCDGKKIPAIGGSDFHRPGLFNSLGVLTYCVYAWSKDPEDILSAIRYASKLDLTCGEASFGDTIDL
ncbi:hypothetical protein [Sporolactobacillus terrae]|uniref:hypothetical protein n=1 Tax=Sporolactobacillus terrae TaxID=269673 RepID=UPI001117D0BC|nr:hypothetical protein [Sporolactobacillus terrae]UAK16400.1 hypothetical protein K7399_15880 [Sporolactobacillus terrae]